MDCLPNFSAFRKLFTRKRPADPIDTVGYERLSSPFGESSIFEDALHEKLDGVQPRSREALLNLPKVTRALDHKLASQGDVQDIGLEGGRLARGWRTQFDNIFRNVPNDKHEFRLTLASGQVVKRSRKEIETHILVQSHLRSAYGDASVRDGAVLSMEQVLASAPEQSAKRSRSEQAPIQVRDELLEPLLGRAENSDVLQRTPRASSVHQVPINYTIPPEDAVAETPTNNVPASASAEFQPSRVAESATDTTVSVSTPQRSLAGVPRLTPAQAEITQFIEQRLHLPPVVFFEEISRHDLTVAAFMTAQAIKMLTHADTGDSFSNDFVQSAHPDILVQKFGHLENFNHCTLADKSALQLATAEGQVMKSAERSLPAALFADLKKEIDRHNALAANTTAQGGRGGDQIFPMGLPGDGHPEPKLINFMQGSASQSARLQEMINMVDGVHQHAELSLTSAVEKIARVEPALAAFVGLVDRLLIFKGRNGSGSTERYHYADSGLPGELLFKPGPDGKDVSTLWPTSMVPGVEINICAPGDGSRTWRIRQGKGYVTGKLKREVIAHTAREALRHLQLTAPEGEGQPIYPVVVYEMLANAAGVPVPAYLREHEQVIVDRLTANRCEADNRAVRNAENSRITAEARGRGQLEIQQECAAKGVRNLDQLFALDENFDCNREQIIGRSIDRTFTVAPKNCTGLEMLRFIQTDRLSGTHIRQAISSRYSPGGRHDNRCWLRSSWAALLSAISPAELLSQHTKLGYGQISQGHRSNGLVLRRIAERFHANPVGFLNIGKSGERWAANSGKAAFLEHLPAADTSRDTDGTSSSRTVDTETFLAETQAALAMCFRREIPSISGEVQGLNSIGFPPGSSDLAITLHRALGVPALIIEAGERMQNASGTSTTAGIQIRAAAPADSELAGFIEAASLENIPMTEDSPVLEGLLHRFADLPIIWLEAGHYEVYVPYKFVNRFG